MTLQFLCYFLLSGFIPRLTCSASISLENTAGRSLPRATRPAPMGGREEGRERKGSSKEGGSGETGNGSWDNREKRREFQSE